LSGSDPYAVALRLLTGREHSRAELEAKLGRRGFTADAVAAVVERCRDLGYLDDGRFARCRARTLMESGRAFGPKLLRDLRRFGIDEETAAQAVAEIQEGRSEQELLADLADRRFPDFCWREADDRERRRVVNYFLRRGFTPGLVLTFFKTKRGTPETP
jgi:regulatory protein